MSSKLTDLLPQARIRLAAMELVGRQGFEKTTVRQIAAQAGVSPGLVIHHFGSKNGVREACDAYAMEVIASEKGAFLASGDMPSLATYMDDHPEMVPVHDYLMRCLVEGGEVAEAIYQRICELTDSLFASAEQAGVVRVPADRQAAIALLAAWTAGSMILGDLVARQLGGQALTDTAVVRRYSMVASEIFAFGIYTPEYFEQLKAALVDPSDKE